MPGGTNRLIQVYDFTMSANQSSSVSSSSSSVPLEPAQTASAAQPTVSVQPIVSFTASQFEQFLNAFREGKPVPTPVTVPLPSDQSYKVNWTHFPTLDLGKAGELDFWFISFEARLRAAQIPEHAWADKFMQCPVVDEPLKMRITGLEEVTYSKIRATILKEHGPIDPINYYRRAMFKVKGSGREEVRDRLNQLLTAHNRASVDAGRESWTEKDLCYPFVEAFSPAVSASLEQQMGLVFAQADPFEHLFRLAPTKTLPTASLHLVHPQVPTVPTPALRPKVQAPKRKNTEMQGVLAALVDLLPKQKLQRRFQGAEAKPQCGKCGRNCLDRGVCPANNVTCFKCNKTGHFASVCRAFRSPVSGTNGTPFPNRNPPRRQFTVKSFDFTEGVTALFSVAELSTARVPVFLGTLAQISIG